MKVKFGGLKFISLVWYYVLRIKNKNKIKLNFKLKIKRGRGREIVSTTVKIFYYLRSGNYASNSGHLS